MAPLTPELAEIARQFAAAKVDASEMVSGLNESQFNWRPDAHTWSMAESLLHLNIIGDRYVHLIEKCLAEGPERGSGGQTSAGFGWVGNWILANTEPPPKRRFKAARSFIPSHGQPLTAVMPTFFHLQQQLTLQLEQASGLDLARVKVPAPGMAPLRFNLYLTFTWIAAHQRRHLWQARQVRDHAGFPR